MKKIIGVTGGVGAGKSSVLEILKTDFHAGIIVADEVGRALMEPGQICYRQIIEAFGTGFLTEEGRLDRARLADVVFQDQEKLERLNQIVHPQVKEAVRQQVKTCQETLVVIEAALLVEAGYREICDELWYVYVPAQERIKRLYEKRGYSEFKSYAIISNQLSDTAFRQNCDFLLDNSRSLAQTRQQIEKRLKETGVVCG